jgi:hypothetical protein
MYHTHTVLAVSGGLLESLSQAVVVVATLLFALMIVAFASYAYKSLSGDGIEWPDDRTGGPSGGADGEEGDDSDSVRRGNSDDEWEFY